MGQALQGGSWHAQDDLLCAGSKDVACSAHGGTPCGEGSADAPDAAAAAADRDLGDALLLGLEAHAGSFRPQNPSGFRVRPGSHPVAVLQVHRQRAGLACQPLVLHMSTLLFPPSPGLPICRVQARCQTLVDYSTAFSPIAPRLWPDSSPALAGAALDAHMKHGSREARCLVALGEALRAAAHAELLLEAEVWGFGCWAWGLM